MNDFDQQSFAFNAVEAPIEDIVAISTPQLDKNDELLELDQTFNFEDFQVVRREFFAHMREPSITFNDCKFYVNSACLKRFPNAMYVQVLIDRESKILALKPCQEMTRDSFQWCRVVKGKREPRQTTCQIFGLKVASLMKWNPLHRYKILGKLIHANGEYLIAFDLTATEVYKKSINEEEKLVTSKTPMFPADWKDQFGMSFYEHQQSLKISTFDGYAVYAIKNKPKGKYVPTALPGEVE